MKDGVKLASCLQGLFEVRYNGDSLDGDATIKLLESINDMKKHSLPGQEPGAARQSDRGPHYEEEEPALAHRARS